MAKKAPTTKKKTTEKEAAKNSKSAPIKSTNVKATISKKSATVNAAKSAQSAKGKLKTVTSEKAVKANSAKGSSKVGQGAKPTVSAKAGTGSKIIETITGLLTSAKGSKSKVVAENKIHKKVAAPQHNAEKDTAKANTKLLKPVSTHKEDNKAPVAKIAKQEVKVDFKHEAKQELKHDAKNEKSKNIVVDKKKQVIAPATLAKEQVKDQIIKDAAIKESKDNRAKGRPGKKGHTEEGTAAPAESTLDQIEAKKGATVEASDVASIIVKDHSETGGSPENFNSEDIRRALAEINFFVSASTDECCERGCDNLAITIGYCRLHYIANWKDLQKKKQVLSEGKLGEMVEDLIRRFPIKFMEAIRDDLTEEKTFYTVLKNLNIDSGYDFDEPEDIDMDSDTDIAPEARAATVRAFEDDSDI